MFVADVGSILQVSSVDRGGGAEAVAMQLHRVYRKRGLAATLMVGRVAGDAEAGVLQLRHGDGIGWRAHDHFRRHGRYRSARIARLLSEPGALLDVMRGHEDFRYPGSREIVHRAPDKPDVVHLHNLHGGYFDVRALPAVAADAPLVATLHDTWLMTGHCAHPLDSDGWRVGCGGCPHLDTYPPLRRDGTAYNWRRKQAIYAQLRVAVVTPCAWLMAMVEESVLAPAAHVRRVIPYGVDRDLFSPRGAGAYPLRGIQRDRPLVLFAAQGGRKNRFKDVTTLEAALERIGGAGGRGFTAVALGAAEPTRQLGVVTLISLPPVAPDEVARWLRAADLYVHPARAETFPLAVIEALACGTPVVATRIGGIPEQIRALGETADPTGILVEPGESDRLAMAITRLLDDRELRLTLAAAAARDAAVRFDVRRQADEYIDLYGEVLDTVDPAAARMEG